MTTLTTTAAEGNQTSNNTSQNSLQVSLLCKSNDMHDFGNFPQGIKFSPDGLCVLTNTASDHKLRLYNIPSLHNNNTTKTQMAPEEEDDDKEEENESSQKQQQAPKKEQYTEDNTIEAIESWKASLICNSGGESVRTYDWYPYMNSNDISSCVFASSSCNQPIHLFDAYDGSIRASYVPMNRFDEIDSPSIIQFTPDGNQIFASGFINSVDSRTIHVFDISRPGKDSTAILNLGKTRRSNDGQKGLVSAIAFLQSNTNSNNNIFAVGTYSPGSIYIYDDRCLNDCSGTITSQPLSTVLNDSICVVGHGKNYYKKRKKRKMNDNVPVGEDDNDDDDVGDDDIFSIAKGKMYQSKSKSGITKLLFSPKHDEGQYMLYSSSRKSNCILCWDIRMISGNVNYQYNNPPIIRGFKSYTTFNETTNQKLGFDFNNDGTLLYVCGYDNKIRIYNTIDGTLAETIHTNDVPNDISYHSSSHSQNDDDMVAVALGTRQFYPSYCLNNNSDTNNYNGNSKEKDSSTDGDNNNNNNNNDKIGNNFVCNHIDPPGSIELYRIRPNNKLTI